MITYSPDTEQPFDLGTVASHECDPGFALVGPMSRTCMEDSPGLVVGVFSETAPTCDRKEIRIYLIHLRTVKYLLCLKS